MKDINAAARSTTARRLPKLSPCAEAVPETKLPEAPEWPEESLESERRFGHAAARLYPFIGRQVQTPLGSGVLWQAFTERAGVILDAEPGKVTFMPTNQVLPGGTPS